MQFTNATPEELGLIITGLRAIHVADQEKVRAKLLAKAEAALAARGLILAE